MSQKERRLKTYFEKNHPEVKLQKYDQYSDSYQALLDGRGDAFSTDNTEVLAWALENKGFEVGITSLGDPDTIAAAVQKGNQELLDFINKDIEKLGKKTSSIRPMKKHFTQPTVMLLRQMTWLLKVEKLSKF